MLFCDKAAAETNTSASTADAGKVRTGGGFRPVASKADAGKGAPAADVADAPDAPATADKGKVRLGGGFRLTTPSA